jgi:hypothetical protein
MTLLDLRPNDAGEIVHAIAHACRPLPDPARMIKESRAVTPLSAIRPHGMPDTYPFGL